MKSNNGFWEVGIGPFESGLEEYKPKLLLCDLRIDGEHLTYTVSIYEYFQGNSFRKAFVS
jgi:hypothetical protein